MIGLISIVGAGRLGGALAIALDKCGYKIGSLVVRNLENAHKIAENLASRPQLLKSSELEKLNYSPLILIATPDSQIELTAKELAGLEVFSLNKSSIFLHTSGALSSEILQDLRAKACGQIGSLHPLVSISDPLVGFRKFENAFFCLEGDTRAVEAAKQIVADLKGKSFSVPTTAKPLYHAAAVMSSGHFVALFDLAIGMLEKCGLKAIEAQEILLPLVRSTIENLLLQSPAKALTGTFARADVETLRRHLAALGEDSAASKIYRELGKQALKLAAEQGADAERLKEMERIMLKVE